MRYMKLFACLMHLLSVVFYKKNSSIALSKRSFSCGQPQAEKAYSSYLDLNLEEVEPCISGPKR
jgi:aconitase A